MNTNNIGRYLLWLPVFIISACGLKYNEAVIKEEWNHHSIESDLFKNFQALQKDNAQALLAGEMIRIHVSNFQSKHHTITFKNIKKELADKGELIVKNDKNYLSPNRVWLRKLIVNDTLFQYNMVYAMANADNNIKVVSATYYMEEQLLKVDTLARYILRHDIPPEIFTDLSVANFDFAGRDLSLDRLCKWESVYVVECADRGKIRWSMHNNLKEAVVAKNIHMAFSKSYQYSEVLKEETVDVIFEGKPVKAQRLVFELKGGWFMRGQSENMIVYYLATEIRANFIHVVLSYYADQAAPGGLPSLIKEVMELPKGK